MLTSSILFFFNIIFSKLLTMFTLLVLLSVTCRKIQQYHLHFINSTKIIVIKHLAIQRLQEAKTMLTMYNGINTLSI